MERIRSRYRAHERSSFYKYSSMSTALNVIRTRSIRWSAPTRFNDPFDVPREASVAFTITELRDACDRELRHLLVTHGPTLHPKIRLLQRAMRQHPESREHFVEELVSTLGQADPPRITAFEMLAEIWRSQVKDLRILCTSEVNTSASTWDRYADRHRGVVLELGCDDEAESALLLAQARSVSGNTTTTPIC